MHWLRHLFYLPKLTDWIRVSLLESNRTWDNSTSPEVPTFQNMRQYNIFWLQEKWDFFCIMHPECVGFWAEIWHLGFCYNFGSQNPYKYIDFCSCRCYKSTSPFSKTYPTLCCVIGRTCNLSSECQVMFSSRTTVKVWDMFASVNKSVIQYMCTCSSYFISIPQASA